MRFVETPIFTRELQNFLKDEDYRTLQLTLLLRPEQGKLIPGSNGLRKLCWGAEGKGKQKGCRIIYYWEKKQDFENLIKSVKQAGKIRRGEMKANRTFKFKPADIRSIRQRFHKSQSEFAMMIGVSVSTLQNWEQGRRKPEGPARALLKIASENPKAVVKSLSS